MYRKLIVFGVAAMRVFYCARRTLVASVLLIGLGSSASAVTTVYQLFDHGYGALGPDYGLRLDELFNGTNTTFSVSSNGAEVFMTYDDVAGTATISGQVYRNVVGGLYDVDYTMSLLTPVGAGFMADAGTGSLVEQGGGLSVSLNGKSDGVSMANFLFNGHRLPGDTTTAVLEGWLWVYDESRSCCNDWLVTATVVPVPAALPLFATALAGAGFFGWRRKRMAEAT